MEKRRYEQLVLRERIELHRGRSGAERGDHQPGVAAQRQTLQAVDRRLRSGARAAVNAAPSCPRSRSQAGTSAGTSQASSATPRRGLVAGADCRAQAQGPGSDRISYESIYGYIYWRSWSFNGTLHRLLPRQKYRRGNRLPNGRWSKTSILDRVSIHDRPAVVDSRTRSGDGEADLMSFRKPGQFLLVAQERRSRRALLMRQKTRTAQSVADNLSAMVEAMPASACQSMTFDNGTEFSKHYLLNRRFGIQTWFCDTHSPWQKGGIENAIGRLRRQLPRKTDLDALPVHGLELCLQRYNDTPRKCLAFKTPNEVFLQLSVALQT
jgi:transposase, IS30 family